MKYGYARVSADDQTPALLPAAVVGAADGSAAGLAASGTFVRCHMVIKPRERMKRAVAHWAVDLRFFAVV